LPKQVPSTHCEDWVRSVPARITLDVPPPQRSNGQVVLSDSVQDITTTSTVTFSNPQINLDQTSHAGTVTVNYSGGANGGKITNCAHLTGSGQTRTTVCNTQTIAPDVVPTPIITSVMPQSAEQGQNHLDVAITGQSTHFVAGTTAVTFSGTGITVNRTAVTDATHASANINIAPDAVIGARNVTVTTAAEIVTLNNAFTVRTPTAPGLPPDPATIAPPLPQLTSFSAATAFLYKGSNPIQTGVGAGTINPTRASVLRGKVITRTAQLCRG
jgi:hypothetical protein